MGRVSILFYYNVFKIHCLAISLLWTPKFTKKIGVLLGYVYVEDRKRVYIKYLTVTYLTSLSLEVIKIGKKNWVLGVQQLPLLWKGSILKITIPPTCMQTENPFLYNLLTPYDQIKFVNAFKTGLKILGKEKCWCMKKIKHSAFEGFNIYFPSLYPTLLAAIGPINGNPDIAKAAEDAIIDKISGWFSLS